MFIQIITGKVVDAGGLARQMERWEIELRPGAEGFLGSTAGVTTDGRGFVAARFDSEEAARRNSDRPEQSAWWAETEKMLSDVVFRDSEEVVTMGGGGSDQARFVQVMRGHVTDAARMAQLRARMAEFEEAMAALRPDVLGDVVAIHGDGTFTDIVYFTSEAEARANEAKEMPAEAQAMFAEWMEVAPVDEYLDLTDPKYS
ncbi:MAG TPA: hypothetical protein VFJ85_19760 [Acidimicrobiales bacterium]|nr:hypothetical protein [Acidimicrobiales bacterium]